MKKLFILLLLFSFSYGQVVNETFNDWTMENDEYVMGHWVFDSLYHNIVTSDSMNKDISDSLNHMTLYLGAWSNYSDMLDSCDRVSPIYENGVVPNFSNASALKQPAADAVDFNFGTDDWTLDAVVYLNVNTLNVYVADKGDGYATGAPGWRFYHNQNGFYLLAMASSDNVVMNTSLILASNIGAWTYLQIIVDRSGYADGYEDQNLDVHYDISVRVADDVTDSDDFIIGAASNELSFYDGYIAELRISRGITRGTQARREVQYLANGWYSKAGKVYRESVTTWYQGFYDSETVFYPLANTNAFWSLTFDAWGGKSGDVVTVNVGDQSGIAQTLTGSSVEYTLSLGCEVTSADSLYFVASAGDTVYIDNVVLTADTTPQIYVSDQGNDSNLGTSVTQAYLTLAKAYGLTLPAGSTVYLFTGDTWTETWTQGTSGSSGLPFTLSVIDSTTGLTGAAALALGDMPIIDSTGTVIDFNGKSYITLEHIEIRNGLTKFNLGTNNIIRYCEFDSADANALLVDGLSNSVYYNLFLNATTDAIEVDSSANTIYNNVFYTNGNGIDVDAAVAFRNNIIRVSGTNDINIAAGITVTGGYNIFEDAAKAGDGTYSGTSDWSTDPLFTDASNDDFTLKFNSPCIDKAFDWGQTEDYSGNGKSGLVWDIGAYEFIKGKRSIYLYFRGNKNFKDR
jgi:hypothetical protein